MTLGDLIDGGYRLTVYCACGHEADLDLEALAARLGRGHSYLRPDLPLVCGACGRRDVTMIVGAPAGMRDRWS